MGRESDGEGVSNEDEQRQIVEGEGEHWHIKSNALVLGFLS